MQTAVLGNDLLLERREASEQSEEIQGDELHPVLKIFKVHKYRKSYFKDVNTYV